MYCKLSTAFGKVIYQSSRRTKEIIFPWANYPHVTISRLQLRKKPSQLIAASPRSVQRTPRRSPGLMEKAKPKVDSEKEGIKLHFGSGSESMAEPKEVIPLPRESAKSHNGGSNIRIH